MKKKVNYPSGLSDAEFDCILADIRNPFNITTPEHGRIVFQEMLMALAPTAMRKSTITSQYHGGRNYETANYEYEDDPNKGYKGKY